MQVNIYEAKSRLSKLLELAAQGEEVVIARSGKPMARLMPIASQSKSRSGVRYGGLNPSRLKLSEDFHSLMSDDELLG